MAKTDVHLYPEGTAQGLAGYASEPTAWRFLRDVAAALADRVGGYVRVSPSQVAIDGDGFRLLADDEPQDLTAYDAPERHEARSASAAASEVWSLGASVFEVVMGCCVMNGRGGRVQKATSKLPYMRQEMPELSRLVQQCLDFDPASRPTLADISRTAQQHCARWQEKIRKGPRLKAPAAADRKADGDAPNSVWPEEMI